MYQQDQPEISTIPSKLVFIEKKKPRLTENDCVQEARVTKGNGPMGLSIVGGVDQACPPFGMDQRGVFVSKV